MVITTSNPASSSPCRQGCTGFQALSSQNHKRDDKGRYVHFQIADLRCLLHKAPLRQKWHLSPKGKVALCMPRTRHCPGTKLEEMLQLRIALSRSARRTEIRCTSSMQPGLRAWHA